MFNHNIDISVSMEGEIALKKKTLFLCLCYIKKLENLLCYTTTTINYLNYSEIQRFVNSIYPKMFQSLFHLAPQLSQIQRHLKWTKNKVATNYYVQTILNYLPESYKGNGSYSISNHKFYARRWLEILLQKSKKYGGAKSCTKEVK